jgi:pimeloyl-ACP methyl ester carboxylesterase
MPVLAEGSVTLPDARRLSWREFGDPRGYPVVNNHGGLLCGLDIAPAESAARRLGIRLISPDRPGVGESTILKGRRTLDWAGDVSVLMDSLGLTRFGAFGWSLGGQYALALGAGLPTRVSAVVVVAGCLPMNPVRISEVNRTDRTLLRLSSDHPRGARRIFRVTGATARRLPSLVDRATSRQLSPPDRSALSTLPDGSFSEWMAHAMTQPEGMIEEYLAWARPWGFEPRDVVASTKVWHGDDDELVPVTWSREMAAEIAEAELSLVPGQGHFVAYSRWDEVLAPFVAR